MTPELLSKVLLCPLARAEKWCAALSDAMIAYQINTPAREAAFLAQIGHESGRLLYVKELWGPTGQQTRYEGRADLGNTEPGDGHRYLGRGLLQITGRANYRAIGNVFGVDFENSPELLQTPHWAARSAAYFWHAHGLNELADAGEFDAISDIINRGHRTRKIGDANGYADRLALYEHAKQLL